MKPSGDPLPLAPLRKKIFKHSLVIIGLYTLVGISLMIEVLLANESNGLSKRVVIISTLLFLFTIFLTLYLADDLATKIAGPLKELAEILRRKPLPGSKLKLPQATSLEMRIFTHEMSRLWDRLSELQKLNLEEIISQRNKFEAVLSSVDDAILVLDNQDQVIHCNPVVIKLINLAPEEILGKRWHDISGTSENYLLLRNLLKPEVTSNQTVELELDGKRRTFSARCRPFYNESKIQIGSLYLLHDITEIRQRDRLKAEFIGVLSHELKTPLQSLNKASGLLFQKRAQMNAEEKTLIETISEDVERIRAVADEFGQVGNVDLQSLKLKMEKVKVGELLPQWIQPFQVLGRDRDVKVNFLQEGSEVILAQIDRVKFPWAISNLIYNAIRVSPPGESVTVYLTDRESRVDIEVRDEGPGISETIRERMFDPYFRGAEGAGEFLGLGLAISKEVVEAHQGRIEYFPKKPQGGIFRISLPLV